MNPPAVDIGRTLVLGRWLRYAVINLVRVALPSRLTPPTIMTIGTATRCIPLRNVLPPLVDLIILAIHNNTLVLIRVSLSNVSTDLRSPQSGPIMFGALSNMTR